MTESDKTESDSDSLTNDNNDEEEEKEKEPLPLVVPSNPLDNFSLEENPDGESYQRHHEQDLRDQEVVRYMADLS